MGMAGHWDMLVSGCCVTKFGFISGRHVVIIANRTILGMSYSRKAHTKGPRPRSRTLTAVQDAILEVRDEVELGLAFSREWARKEIAEREHWLGAIEGSQQPS